MTHQNVTSAVMVILTPEKYAIIWTWAARPASPRVFLEAVPLHAVRAAGASTRRAATIVATTSSILERFVMEWLSAVGTAWPWAILRVHWAVKRTASHSTWVPASRSMVYVADPTG